MSQRIGPWPPRQRSILRGRFAIRERNRFRFRKRCLPRATLISCLCWPHRFAFFRPTASAACPRLTDPGAARASDGLTAATGGPISGTGSSANSCMVRIFARRSIVPSERRNRACASSAGVRGLRLRAEPGRERLRLRRAAPTCRQRESDPLTSLSDELSLVVAETGHI